jgi:hypothetical protein
MLWVKLHMLSNYLQSIAFGSSLMNRVSKGILQKYVIVPKGCSVIASVYSSAVGDYGLRRLMVAMMVWRIDERGCGKAEWKNALATILAEFSHDLVSNSVN